MAPSRVAPTGPRTPLPLVQVAAICSMNLINSASYLVTMPQVPFLVLHFFPALSEAQVGFYSGLLEGSFHVGAFVGAFAWGIFSDTHGRRPAMLLGLLGTVVSCLMFGLAPSFGMAMASKFVWGLLNGNVGVTKTALSELTDDTNSAKAFSFIGVATGIGRLVGPTLGGLLSKPASQYPGTFGGVWLFETFPFLLPCMALATMTAITYVVAWFSIEETLPSRVKHATGGAADTSARASAASLPDDAGGAAQPRQQQQQSPQPAPLPETSSPDELHGSDEHEGIELLGPTEGRAAPTGHRSSSSASSFAQRLRASAFFAGGSQRLSRLSSRAPLPTAGPPAAASAVGDVELAQTSAHHRNGSSQPQSKDTVTAAPTAANGHDGIDATVSAVASAGSTRGPAGARREQLADSSDDAEDADDGHESAALAVGSERSQRRQLPSAVVAPSAPVVTTAAPADRDRGCGGWLRRNRRMAQDRAICGTASVYALLSLFGIVASELYPLYVVNDAAHGGFSWQMRDIGTLPMLCGVPMIIYQLFIYDAIVKRLGLMRTLRLSLASLAVAFAATPLCSLTLRASTQVQWVVVSLHYMFTTLVRITCFTSVFVLVANSAHAAQRGQVNGFSQALAACVRAAGPPVATAIFAWSVDNPGVPGVDFGFAWTLVAVVVLATLGTTYTLPAWIEHKRGPGDH